MAPDVARVRSVGFVGHGGVGKTSLVEAILFRTGMTSRLGRVDDGTATTYFDPEEVKRKISITIGVAHGDYRDHRFNLVDMPGYGDFIAEARAGLRVVKGAGVVADAGGGGGGSSGVRGASWTLWRASRCRRRRSRSSPRNTACPGSSS